MAVVQCLTLYMERSIFVGPMQRRCNVGGEVLFLFCKGLFDRCLIYMREKFAQVKCSAFDDPFFGGGRGEQGIRL